MNISFLWAQSPYQGDSLQKCLIIQGEPTILLDCEGRNYPQNADQWRCQWRHLKMHKSVTRFTIHFDLSGVFAKPFNEKVIWDVCTGYGGHMESSTFLSAEEKAVMEFIVDLNQLMSTPLTPLTYTQLRWLALGKILPQILVLLQICILLANESHEVSSSILCPSSYLVFSRVKHPLVEYISRD